MLSVVQGETRWEKPASRSLPSSYEPASPRLMFPDERIAELSHILARGLIRLKARQSTRVRRDKVRDEGDGREDAGPIKEKAVR